MGRFRFTERSHGSLVARSLSLGRAKRGPEGWPGMTLGERYFLRFTSA